jgi:hypothetical protein
MDFFTSLSLLIGLGLLVFAFRRDKLVDPVAYRGAFQNFIIAVIVHNPAAELLVFVPPPGVLALLARIVGYIFIVMSFRQLCLAWGAPLTRPQEEPPKQQ